jgi:hypothetical protein
MKFDPDVVAGLIVNQRPRAWVRLTPVRFAASPLGLGYGETRFAGPSKSFKVLYIAKSLATGVAETIVRDRFAGKARRRLTRDEVEDRGITEVACTARLSLLDLRTTGLVQLGVTANAVRGKTHGPGRRFSEALYALAPRVDGILYPSRLTNDVCIAVYDRAVHKLSAVAVYPVILQRDFIPALMTLNVAVV